MLRKILTTAPQATTRTLARCFPLAPRAVSVQLLLAYLNFVHRPGSNLQHILHLPQLNLFDRRDLLALPSGDLY